MKRKGIISGFAVIIVLLVLVLGILIVKIVGKERQIADAKTEAAGIQEDESGKAQMEAADMENDAGNEVVTGTDGERTEPREDAGQDVANPEVEEQSETSDKTQKTVEEENVDTVAVLASLVIMQKPEMYTYAQMEMDLKQIASAFPTQVTFHSLCTTYDQREMYELVIGDINAGKHVMINASIHAREYITTQVLMQQVCAFLQEHGADAQSYLGDTAIHVIPMVNPDGVTISQYGIEGLQTAEAKATVKSIAEMEQPSDQAAYYRRWKSNAQGIDINRTFDAKWESYDDQVHHPSSDHYKGVQVNDTVESQALVNLTKQYSFAKTISYHTQGNVIYWYFGQSGTLYDDTLALAQAAGNITGYGLDANYENLDPAGYKDWAIIKMGIPSITVEIGTDYSPVDPAQYDTLWAQNKNMWDALIG